MSQQVVVILPGRAVSVRRSPEPGLSPCRGQVSRRHGTEEVEVIDKVAARRDATTATDKEKKMR